MKFLWTGLRRPAAPQPTRRVGRRTRRMAGVEPCEARLPLAADALNWGAGAHLTLSFAPDGTSLAGQPSALFAKFDGLTSTANWQESVVRAFQTWAQHTNADLGVVADGGEPFGSEGATRQDARFGDVRVGARPMRNDVYAISVPQDVVSGTWAGDLIFNSEANFQNADEIFRVALHEAGNIFGLQDNQDPNSPLYSAGVIPTAVVPTNQDLATLQANYGTRVADLSDAKDSNQTLSRATRIQYSTTDGFNGSTPLIVNGDLQSRSDTDWYRFDPMEGYSGNVTVTLRTQGMSLLRPRISLHNRDGVELAAASTLDVLGAKLTITFQPGSGDERYYIQVNSTSDDPYAVGGYSLLVTLDQALQTDPGLIEQFTGGSLRGLSQDQIQRFFLPEPGHSSGLINDDLHLDDQLTTATILAPNPGFVDGIRYEVAGSVADGGDVDVYEFSTPAAASNWVGVLRLRGVDGLLMVTDVELVDTDGNVIPMTTLVHNDREIVVQASVLTANKPYYVRLIPSQGTAGVEQTRNYVLSVGLGHESVELQEFAQGELTPSVSHTVHAWSTPTWQLVHFLLEVPADGTPDQEVQFLLRDQALGIAVRLTAGVGQTRSDVPRLIPPGNYELVVSSSSKPGMAIAYRILGLVLSDPLAVPPDDPLFDPLVDCPGHVLCFPSVSDVNSDGLVDANDAEVMFAMWGTDNAFADFNADGIVDAADAGVIFSAWTG